MADLLEAGNGQATVEITASEQGVDLEALPLARIVREVHAGNQQPQTQGLTDYAATIYERLG